MHAVLTEILLLLAAAVFAVPLFRRFGLGAVLGYLFAGVLIGPSFTGLISDVTRIQSLSELGVVLLLFVIGLELQPSRLWVLRRPVFGLGSLQVVACSLLFGGLAALLGLHWQAALVVGVALSLSSTAVVLQVMSERRELTTRHGRDAFAVLLFQDLAAIPVLSLLPALAGRAEGMDWLSALRILGLLVAFLLAGRWGLRPLLGWVARSGNSEVFTAMALLLVVGAAVLAEQAGLTMSLGAFLAGVLLSGSAYRHALEADITPFKGILLGLFFMAVGMGANFSLLLAHPGWMLGGLLAWLVLKTGLLLALGWIAGQRDGELWRFAALMAVGGEFAFVMLAQARSLSLLPAMLADSLVVLITLSMMLSPLMLWLLDRWLARRRPVAAPVDPAPPPPAPVLIIGFGRFGQIVARLLRAHGIRFTAIDIDPARIEFVGRFGIRVYFGDARQTALLQTAGMAEAQLVVLAVGDVARSLEIARVLREAYPDRKVLARARNRQHVYQLWQLGIRQVWRETFDSALSMGRAALEASGLTAARARRDARIFRQRDEALLVEQAEIYQNEPELVQSMQHAMNELRTLFERQDEADAAGGPSPAVPAAEPPLRPDR